MAHYAIINDSNVVTKVITGVDEDSLDTLPEGFTSWEDWYKNHLKVVKVLRCSYNTQGGVHYTQTEDGPVASDDQSKAFRANYPWIGWLYDEANDIFHEPQPYPSWTLNTTTGLWEAPVAKPEGVGQWTWLDWDEDAYQADNTQGWVIPAE